MAIAKDTASGGRYLVEDIHEGDVLKTGNALVAYMAFREFAEFRIVVDTATDSVVARDKERDAAFMHSVGRERAEASYQRWADGPGDTVSEKSRIGHTGTSDCFLLLNAKHMMETAKAYAAEHITSPEERKIFMESLFAVMVQASGKEPQKQTQQAAISR